jgi:hypothetical protein
VNPATQAWLLVALAPVVIIGMLGILSFSFRVGTGWYKLRRFQRATPPRSTQRASWVRIGACFFRNCGIQVALSEEGLYLRVPMAIPGVLVPWEEIEADGLDGFKLGVSQGDPVSLRVRDALAERIRAYLPGAAAPSRITTAHEPDRCPYCHDDLRAGALGACVSCGTQHHAECLVEHGGCAIMGCDGWPPDREAPSGSPLKA